MLSILERPQLQIALWVALFLTIVSWRLITHRPLNSASDLCWSMAVALALCLAHFGYQGLQSGKMYSPAAAFVAMVLFYPLSILVSFCFLIWTLIWMSNSKITFSFSIVLILLSVLDLTLRLNGIELFEVK